MTTLNVETIKTPIAPLFEAEEVIALGDAAFIVGEEFSTVFTITKPVTKFDKLEVIDFSKEGITGILQGKKITITVSSSVSAASDKEIVTFKLKASLNGASSYKNYSVRLKLPAGQIAYTEPGTYSFLAPLGVSEVSVVAVGGGGGGYDGWANAAGAGGGLGWKNNIPVTPGQSYTVVVGTGGTNAANGGNSYFIGLGTVAGYGGGSNGSSSTGGPNGNGNGGGWFGDGGGAGGNASNYQGGGGAGGYTGNGGNQSSLPVANSGGGAGGGYYSSTYGSGGGGGVGLLGKSATATGWYHGSSGQVFSTSSGNGGGGQGGSGGTRGLSGENPTNSTGESSNNIYGGTHGGGGGGPGSSWPSAAGNGGPGGLRIIWGAGRAYPNTNTGDVS